MYFYFFYRLASKTISNNIQYGAKLQSQLDSQMLDIAGSYTTATKYPSKPYKI